MPLKQHLKTYGQSTSIKGISKVVKSRSLCLKVLWFIAFAVGLSAGLYQVTTILITYLSYTTVTKISICNTCHPPFPDVTLCNANPFGMLDAFQKENPGVVISFKEYQDRLLSIADNDPTVASFMSQYNMTEYQMWDMFLELFTLHGYFHNINITAVYEFWLSNGNKGLVNDCHWYDWEERLYTKEHCLYQSKYYVETSQNFVCTTIHVSDTNMFSAKDKVKGFMALLYLNRFSDIFMTSYYLHMKRSQASGVRVVIHPPNTYPDTTKGITIPPGHEVEIHLKANKVSHLPHPYSNCRNDDAVYGTSDSGVDYAVNLTYSRETATAMCKQEYYIRKCGCFHPSYPVTPSLMKKFPAVHNCLRSHGLQEDKNYENIIDTELLKNMKCYMFSDDESEEDNLDSICPYQEVCNYYEYEQQIQSSPWPDETYILQFYCSYIDSQYCLESAGTTAYPEFSNHFDIYKDIFYMSRIDEEAAYAAIHNLHATKNLISRNFIQLKVMFPDSGELRYTDVPSVTTDALFGNLGGLLNLWIGFTFFTLIEWADLFFVIILDCVKKNSVSDVTEKTVPDIIDQPGNVKERINAYY